MDGWMDGHLTAYLYWFLSHKATHNWLTYTSCFRNTNGNKNSTRASLYAQGLYQLWSGMSFQKKYSVIQVLCNPSPRDLGLNKVNLLSLQQEFTALWMSSKTDILPNNSQICLAMGYLYIFNLCPVKQLAIFLKLGVCSYGRRKVLILSVIMR